MSDHDGSKDDGAKSRPTGLRLLRPVDPKPAVPAAEPSLAEKMIAAWTADKDSLKGYDSAVIVLSRPDGHISVSAHGKDMAAGELCGMLVCGQYILLNGLLARK